MHMQSAAALFCEAWGSESALPLLRILSVSPTIIQTRREHFDPTLDLDQNRVMHRLRIFQEYGQHGTQCVQPGERPDHAFNAVTFIEDCNNSRANPRRRACTQAQHRQGSRFVVRCQSRGQRRQRHEARQGQAVEGAEDRGDQEVVRKRLRHEEEQRRADRAAHCAKPQDRVAITDLGADDAGAQVADDVEHKNDGQQAQPLFQGEANGLHEETWHDHQKAKHRRGVDDADDTGQ